MSEFLPSRIRARVRKTVIRRSKPITITVQSKFILEEVKLLHDLADFVKAWVQSSDSKSTTLSPTWEAQQVSFYDNLTAPKSHLSILGTISKVALSWKRPKKGAAYLMMTWTLDVSPGRDTSDKVKNLNEAGTNGVLYCSFSEGEGHQQEIPGADKVQTRKRGDDAEAIREEILAFIDKKGEFWIEDITEMQSVEGLLDAKARTTVNRAIQQLVLDGKIAMVEERKSPRPERKGAKVKVFKKVLDI